jgi:hypothetical protein
MKNIQTKAMRWNQYISYFFGGAFLINAIPYLMMGVTGHPFQSPFATPPGYRSVPFFRENL